MSLDFKNPIILFNPYAGAGKSQKRFKEYYNILLKSNLFNKIDSIETNSTEDAISKIKQICLSKKNDLIISIGGDGTISTIVNGLMNLNKEDRLPLFPLPSGSGDSLIKDFNIKNIYNSIENYKNKATIKNFDLLLVENPHNNFKYYCINILGMGFISDIVVEALAMNKKFGALSYFFGTFIALKNFKPYKTKLIINDNEIFQSDKVYFLTVSNTRYTGGSLKISPQAKYDDQLMDLVILYDINRIQFLSGFFKTFKGKHIFAKGCLYRQIKSLEIESEPDFVLMPDGELKGNSPVKISILPKEISLVI